MADDRAARVGPTRRDVIVGAAAAVAVSGHAVALAENSSFSFPDTLVARGTVTDQATGAGIPGVLVSNGHDVVPTAHDGSWRLPVADGQSIFVIKPAGWEVPRGDEALPRFFHLHQPYASPATFDARFPGVAPTGPLPAHIDFPLVRSAEFERFDVLLVADTQPHNATELGFVRDALLSCVPATAAAFAIHHGDVMGDDLDLYERYVGMLGATGIPWHHCPGNHDMNLETPDGRFAFETWKRIFGPTHYAFQHGRATFILLNNVDYLGRGNFATGERGYRGRIGPKQLAFVENLLHHVPRDQLVVVSMHIPLVNFEEPLSEADTTVDRDALLALLARHPHTVSFSGHSHTTEHHYLGVEHGFARAEPHHHHVLTAACGSWWSGPPDHRGIPVSVSRDGSPKGFHVLSIDGNRYATRFVPMDAGSPAGGDMRMVISCPDDGREPPSGVAAISCHVPRMRLGAARIAVDVFDGGPRTTVEIEIGGRRIALDQVADADPFVIDFFARHPETCKPWVAASPCSHLWAAPLPPDLAAGAYRVTARARDEYGREQLAHMVLEITA
jgi:hypothetical protein